MNVTRTITVPEIFCDTCKTAIESALNPLGGVQRANVDVDAREVTVEYDEAVIDQQALVATIVDQGYDVPDQE